jgi:hypothetical protein
MPVGPVTPTGIFTFRKIRGIPPRDLAGKVSTDTLITIIEHQFSWGASAG